MTTGGQRVSNIATDLWGVVHTMRMPGGIDMNTRMTVVRLADGSLVLISPVPIDDALAEELSKLGPVRYAVSPNCWHHLYLPQCLARYPDAVAYGPPGIKTKRPDVVFAGILEHEAPAPWRDQIDQRVILGVPDFNEVMFYHRASQTLIATDMVFNIQHPQGWKLWFLLHFAGTYKRFACSRLLRMYIKDNAAVGTSVGHVLEWEFERVVMAHGEVFEPGAREACAQIWARFRRSVRALPAHNH